MAYYRIPPKYRSGLQLWIEQGIQPGGFLCAVLRNDFGDAVARADESTTFEDFLALRRFLYNHAPGASYGTAEAFVSWPQTLQQQLRSGLVWDAEDGAWIPTH